MNNQDILAARVGAVLRCRSLEGNDHACYATGALHRIPPAHPSLPRLFMDSRLPCCFLGSERNPFAGVYLERF